MDWLAYSSTGNKFGGWRLEAGARLSLMIEKSDRNLRVHQRTLDRLDVTVVVAVAVGSL